MMVLWDFKFFGQGKFWILTSVLTGIAFEIFQGMTFGMGTFDWMDMMWCGGPIYLQIKKYMKKFNRSVVSFVGVIAFLTISISCYFGSEAVTDCNQFPIDKVVDYNLLIKVLDRETNLPISNAEFTLDFTKTFLKLKPGEQPPCVLEKIGFTNHELSNNNGIVDFTKKSVTYTSKLESMVFNISINAEDHIGYSTTIIEKAPVGNLGVKFIPLTVYLLKSRIYP
ncbi:MAG: hypothetical protein IPO92_00930 [Saprospiraceae bacterium]|nr:hypothetical protein [Saprospiraceae bacterium]